MIAADALRAELYRQVDDAGRIRPTHDEIAHEDEAVLASKANVGEQTLELLTTPMNITNDYGTAHSTERRRVAKTSCAWG